VVVEDGRPVPENPGQDAGGRRVQRERA